MTANPIWIAAYGGPPPAAVGASAVWIAPGDGTVLSAVASYIAGYFNPVAGASPVWIAGYGGPPPAAIGATPITIVGYGGFGGSVAPPVTSVWSAADAAANAMTLSNGGLTVTPSGALGLEKPGEPRAVYQAIRSSISKSSGKLYVEFKTSSAVTNWQYTTGLADAGITITAQLGISPKSIGFFPQTTTAVAGGFTSNYTSNLQYLPAAGDVYAIAVDFGSGSVWLAYNNTWSNSSNPATGSLPIVSFTPATIGALFAAMCFNGVDCGVWTLQSTAASQTYAPPSGFSAWDAP